MKKLFNLGTISRQFCNQKSKQIIQQYNNTINKLRQSQQKQSQQKTFEKVLKQSSRKLKQLSQQQKLKQIRQYLVKQINTNKQQKFRIQTQSQTKQYIPNGLVVKKLKFIDKKILMLGVDEENEDHCIYIKKMAQKMNTKILLTALSPDMPYFIKTQLSYIEEWQKFVTIPSKTKQSKFYLNSTPYHINDMCLKFTHKSLVREGLNKSKQFNQIFYTILQHFPKSNVFIPNALLTPLLINCVEKLYFCDYPILKERELWALTIPTSKLRQLFGIYHREYHKQKQSYFDPRILFPKQVISRKFKHIANAIKFASYEAIQPAIFVCPSQYTQLFCMQWKLNTPVSAYSDFTYEIDGQKKTRFIDFVQNLVIMDIILEPIIQKYFISYWSFPFNALQTLGGKQNVGKIFIVWKHFYNIYSQALKKVPTM